MSTINWIASFVCGKPFKATSALPLMASALTLCAADPASSNSPPSELLLLDAFGRAVTMATNQVPQSLQPPAAVGLLRQTPDPIAGASLPPQVLQRMAEARQGAPQFQFFPPVPPQLMPYLASQDEFGNTALRPGALHWRLQRDEVEQGAKYLALRTRPARELLPELDDGQHVGHRIWLEHAPVLRRGFPREVGGVRGAARRPGGLAEHGSGRATWPFSRQPHAIAAGKPGHAR